MHDATSRVASICPLRDPIALAFRCEADVRGSRGLCVHGPLRKRQ